MSIWGNGGSSQTGVPNNQQHRITETVKWVSLQSGWTIQTMCWSFSRCMIRDDHSDIGMASADVRSKWSRHNAALCFTESIVSLQRTDHAQPAFYHVTHAHSAVYAIARCLPVSLIIIIIIIRTFVTRAVSANILNLRRRSLSQVSVLSKRLKRSSWFSVQSYSGLSYLKYVVREFQYLQW